MEIRGGNLVYAPLRDTRNVVESFGYINPNKPKSQKKHYGFHLFSEITSSKLLQGTHKK